jgi:hypothetical protein
MTERTKMGHIGLWFRCVRVVGCWVGLLFGTVLVINAIAALAQAHHGILATLLGAVGLTLFGGTMFYLADRFMVNPSRYR